MIVQNRDYVYSLQLTTLLKKKHDFIIENCDTLITMSESNAWILHSTPGKKKI